MRLVTGLRTRTQAFPRRFWLLVCGTCIYLVGYDLCYPFETIYLHGHLGLSMTTIGLILGLPLFAGLPMLVIGGAIADHLGRRWVLILGISASVTLFEGLALAHSLWQLVACISFEAACGWAMFMTASNAIVADLTAVRQRAEAYSISRVAVYAGMVLGPLAASLLLRSGLPFRPLFAIGGGVCAVFLVVSLVWLKETKPDLADGQQTRLKAAAGYRVVLSDRRFLRFCALTLLPLYGFGQLWVTFPVVLRSLVGVSASTWGLLIALYALAGALFQYPVVRRLRGRYMGAWTLVWTGGTALGPTLGGLAVDHLGARGAYAAILAAGLLGSVLFALQTGQQVAPAAKP